MKRKLIVSILVATLLMIPCASVHGKEEPANRAGNQAFLDNDEANIPNGTNSWTGTWDYLSGSKHYRGDARTSRSVSGVSYIWGYKGATGPFVTYPEVYAYLNDAKFSCSQTYYRLYVLPTGVPGTQSCVMTAILNQNTAPVGWGYVGRASVTGGSKRISHVTLTPTVQTGYVGADGIRISY